MRIPISEEKAKEIEAYAAKIEELRQRFSKVGIFQPESRIAIAEGMCYTTSMKQRKSVGVRAGRSRMAFALVPVQEKTSLKV